MKVGPPVRMHVIALFAEASEANYGAERDTRAVDRASGIVQADVVELRAQREVGQNADINAPANAIREVGIGAAAVAKRQMPGTRQKLSKRSDLRRVVHDDSRAKKKRVGVQRNASGRSVVAAKVSNDTQKGDRFIGDRTADTVLAEVCAASQVKVGVSNGSVGGGLGARRYGKEEQSKAK